MDFIMSKYRVYTIHVLHNRKLFDRRVWAGFLMALFVFFLSVFIISWKENTAQSGQRGGSQRCRCKTLGAEREIAAGIYYT